MAGRVALVTGASGGIGFAIAEMLGSLGYDLTLVARRPEPLEEAAERLRQDRRNVIAVAANLADEEQIKRAVREHEHRFGRLDVLVNNAGIALGGAIETAATKLFDLQTAVNFRAPFLLIRECIPMLRRAGGEHGEALVVNISSITGKYAHGGAAAYAATKHALIALTQSLQQELLESGVKATALCPGFVNTASMLRQFDLMPEWLEKITPERMIQPRDLAEAVRFLLTLSPACVVPEIVLGRLTAYPGVEP